MIHIDLFIPRQAIDLVWGCRYPFFQNQKMKKLKNIKKHTIGLF